MLSNVIHTLTIFIPLSYKIKQLKTQTHMKKIEITLYEFSELSKEAKQHALEINANESEYFWGDDAIKSLQKFAEHFNCELKNYYIDWYEKYRNEIFFSVPDYVKDYSEDELKEIIEGMGTYNKKTLKGLGDCKFTGVCFDEDAADGARIAFYNGERDVKEILYAGYESWYKASNSDYMHQLSEEGFNEHCEANEYTFEEDGTLNNG